MQLTLQIITSVALQTELMYNKNDNIYNNSKRIPSQGLKQVSLKNSFK